MNPITSTFYISLCLFGFSLTNRSRVELDDDLDAGPTPKSVKSDAVECDGLCKQLTTISFKNRSREEFEDNGDTVINTRPSKRIRLIAGPRPGRLPYSSYIETRRRLRARSPRPAAASTSPGAHAPAVVEGRRSHVRFHVADVPYRPPGPHQYCRHWKSVKRTKKTSRNSPFPISSKRRGPLARGTQIADGHQTARLARTARFLYLDSVSFLFIHGPMPQLDLSPSIPASIYTLSHTHSLRPSPPPAYLLNSFEDTPTADEPRERYCLERGRTIGLTTCPVSPYLTASFTVRLRYDSSADYVFPSGFSSLAVDNVPRARCWLDTVCFATSFLQYSAPAACWTLIGTGIRLVQDVGGDIDADHPIGCDNGFWENQDPKKVLVQLPGKPCLTTFFNCYSKLNNILAFRLKMLTHISRCRGTITLQLNDERARTVFPHKTKKLLAYRDQGWVDRFDSGASALGPKSSFRPVSPSYCSSYEVQMTIHRPAVHTDDTGGGADEPTVLGDLHQRCAFVQSRCRYVEAAEESHACSGSHFLGIHARPVILLLNVWSGKRTGLPPHMNSAITEASLWVCEKMRVADCGYLLADPLYELATIGQVPLPKDANPVPTSVAAATPTRPNGHKRGREDDDDAPQSQHPHTPAPPVVHPPYAKITIQPLLRRGRDGQFWIWHGHGYGRDGHGDE
ncbi:hypothetical protein B0H14DRAFT_3499470 [Mycena olivaceomarginata]|nr:hypothetical protein B0H14DRAFT_3499470 [Mycena olivaceomarginata]